MLKPQKSQAGVILLIPGSGSVDHDGNSSAGLKASTYRLLAEGLAGHGFTTVRIDKRGLFASAGAVTDANAVTINDCVTDIRSWTAVIRHHTGSSCIWLLGHSEGGLVAMIAAAAQPDVCGLILISTPGRPLGELLKKQITDNPANEPLLNQALPAITSLEQGKNVDVTNMHPALKRLFNPHVQGFMISAFSYDPAKILSAYKKPVLLLQGQRDIQVSAEDAALLKKADPQATLVLLPNVNHILKTVDSDDRSANIATYADPDLPLAPGVVNAISRFLQKFTK